MFWVLRFRVDGIGCQALVLQDLGFMAKGLRCYGLGFRVHGV